MYLTRFWLDMVNRFIPGWVVDPDPWAIPGFEFQAASTLVSLYNQVQPDAGMIAWYNEDNDEFCFKPDSESPPGCYPAEHIIVDGTDLKVYRIGERSWRWDEDSEA